MYWATNKQVERANQEVASLLARLGAAQERANELEKRQAEVAASLRDLGEVIKRLNRTDPAHLTKVLDAASRPEASIPGQLSALRIELDGLADEVHTIYHLAWWSREKSLRNDPNVFRNALSEAWPLQHFLMSLDSRSAADDKALTDYVAMLKSVVVSKLKRRDDDRPDKLMVSDDVLKEVKDGSLQKQIQAFRDGRVPLTTSPVPEPGDTRK
jgi:hypothetical protein